MCTVISLLIEKSVTGILFVQCMSKLYTYLQANKTELKKKQSSEKYK